MPVLNPSVAPLVVIAPRGMSARAIRDTEVVTDVALALKPAFAYGPRHTPSAEKINLTAHAARIQTSGGALKEVRDLETKYAHF